MAGTGAEGVAGRECQRDSRARPQRPGGHGEKRGFYPEFKREQ